MLDMAIEPDRGMHGPVRHLLARDGTAVVWLAAEVELGIEPMWLEESSKVVCPVLAKGRDVINRDVEN